MAALAPYSYEHPRRCRPFQSPVQNTSRFINKENITADSPKSAYVEHVIARIERSFQEKFDLLVSRMEKCSDLSIASSRAVGVLSTQLDELRVDQEDRFKELSQSVNELRSSTTRLCAESQNLTMTAIEECCSEIMASVQENTIKIGKLEKDSVKVQQMQEAAVLKANDEMAVITETLASIPDQFSASLDEMISDLNGRFDHQAGVVYDRIEERVDALRLEFEDANLKQEAYNEETYNSLRSVITSKPVSTPNMQTDLAGLHEVVGNLDSRLNLVDKSLVKLETGFIDRLVFEKLCADIAQVQTSLTVFSTESIPTIYQDVDSHTATHSAQLELKLRQMVCELMHELALDLQTQRGRSNPGAKYPHN